MNPDHVTHDTNNHYAHMDNIEKLYGPPESWEWSDETIAAFIKRAFMGDIEYWDALADTSSNILITAGDLSVNDNYSAESVGKFVINSIESEIRKLCPGDYPEVFHEIADNKIMEEAMDLTLDFCDDLIKRRGGEK